MTTAAASGAVRAPPYAKLARLRGLALCRNPSILPRLKGGEEKNGKKWVIPDTLLVVGLQRR